MSLYNFFTAGYNPTISSSAPTNAQLLQMWQEGKPSTGAGMIVWGDAAPDVVAYPDLALCIWGETDAGVPTGYFYTYNGTSWTGVLIVPGTLDGESFVDGTIPISKLEPGTALYVLRTNSAGNGLEWVSIGSAIANGTITPAQLQNAATSGYILRSGTGGVFATVLLQTAVENLNIPIATVKDTLSNGQPNQVPYLIATGGSFGFSYLEALMRANQTPTSKLQFASGLAGKWLKVNTAGNDVEGATATIEVATFVDTAASGTAAQSILANTVTTLRIAAEATLPTWASVATNEITLTAGTYLIEATVPFYKAGGTGNEGYVSWVEGGTVRKTANAYVTVDGDYDHVPLTYKTTLAATTVCKLQAFLDADFTVGRANGLAGIAEVYTQLKITRL